MGTGGASGDVNWNGNDWHVENQILHFPAAQGKSLRIKVNSANLQWNHYAINEILVKDSSASPLNANIATESTSEWNSENGGLLTDGDHSEAARAQIGYAANRYCADWARACIF